jgi:cyclopropane-fatty-acyl-phospholipid synthase
MMYKRLVSMRLSGLGIQVHAKDKKARFIFQTGEQFDLDVLDQGFWRDWVLRGSLGLGETYVDHKWDIDPDKLEPFIRAMLAHGAAEARLIERLYLSTTRALGIGYDADDPEKSHTQSSHHYDRGNDLFSSFLDEDMVYTCAFFDDLDWDLETAQRHKIDVTLGRLDIFKGASVLDIGCGWGAVAIEAARRGAKVTGITLSEQQISLARERAAEQQMKVDFQVADYRPFAEKHAGEFDRIVSVGMFEHVGRKQFGTFFGALHQLLKPGGKAVVHSIVDWPFGPVAPWLERYIFPGSEVPKTYDLVREATREGLRVEAGPHRHEGVHYATTVAHWRKRFLANYPDLDHDKYPEKFKRMWLISLAGGEAAYRGTGLHNAQVVYTRP